MIQQINSVKDETKLLREHMKVTDTLCETSESVSRTHDGVLWGQKMFSGWIFFYLNLHHSYQKKKTFTWLSLKNGDFQVSR